MVRRGNGPFLLLSYHCDAALNPASGPGGVGERYGATWGHRSGNILALRAIAVMESMPMIIMIIIYY